MELAQNIAEAVSKFFPELWVLLADFDGRDQAVRLRVDQIEERRENINGVPHNDDVFLGNMVFFPRHSQWIMCFGDPKLVLGICVSSSSHTVASLIKDHLHRHIASSMNSSDLL